MQTCLRQERGAAEMVSDLRDKAIPAKTQRYRAKDYPGAPTGQVRRKI